MAKAKRTPKRKSAGGPYLAAAVFCDNILQGEDGALSAIRIIDQINLVIPSGAPPDVPSELQRVPIAVWTLLMFKSGDARGEREVSLAIHSPSGKKTIEALQKIVFGDSPSGGVNLRLHLNLAIATGGLYTVDVCLDGKKITCMPLTISIKREEATLPTPTQSKRAKPKRKASKRLS